jgi:hypothetical protein
MPLLMFFYIYRHTELQSIHSFVTFAQESDPHWAVTDFEYDSNPDFFPIVWRIWCPIQNIIYPCMQKKRSIMTKSPIILHLCAFLLKRYHICTCGYLVVAMKQEKKVSTDYFCDKNERNFTSFMCNGLLVVITCTLNTRSIFAKLGNSGLIRDWHYRTERC